MLQLLVLPFRHSAKSLQGWSPHVTRETLEPIPTREENINALHYILHISSFSQRCYVFMSS